MKTDDSKKWNEMTLKCEASFSKCDKCEVKYPWYDPHEYLIGAGEVIVTVLLQSIEYRIM